MKKVIAYLAGLACIAMSVPSFSAEEIVGGFKMTVPKKGSSLVEKEIRGEICPGAFLKNLNAFLFVGPVHDENKIWSIISYAKGASVKGQPQTKSLASLNEIDCKGWRIKKLNNIGFSDYFAEGDVTEQFSQNEWLYPMPQSVIESELQLLCTVMNAVKRGGAKW